MEDGHDHGLIQKLNKHRISPRNRIQKMIDLASSHEVFDTADLPISLSQPPQPSFVAEPPLLDTVIEPSHLDGAVATISPSPSETTILTDTGAAFVQARPTEPSSMGATLSPILVQGPGEPWTPPSVMGAVLPARSPEQTSPGLLDEMDGAWDATPNLRRQLKTQQTLDTEMIFPSRYGIPKKVSDLFGSRRRSIKKRAPRQG
ncbi:Incenp [Carpediemonas membranifera]|uniref:Incenp n=1 Tax=Carpediemonas membranifera TaxID=201153 RepID=A0A8J6ATW5_9EUKA|nr:Incenp [Carpediemonas membranifera]|eukprot:KAG9394018.1 Incenp [Carpediemonas membranifera]